jgi:hypothetical protein
MVEFVLENQPLGGQNFQDARLMFAQGLPLGGGRTFTFVITRPNESGVSRVSGGIGYGAWKTRRPTACYSIVKCSLPSRRIVPARGMSLIESDGA